MTAQIVRLMCSTYVSDSCVSPMSQTNESDFFFRRHRKNHPLPDNIAEHPRISCYPLETQSQREDSMNKIIRVSRSDLLKSTGEFFHVYNRGVDRQLVFRDRDDYMVFIDLMAKWIRPDELRMHTFNLMPNHFHLILQQLTPYAISRFQKPITEGLARWVNRRSRRVGHLFQGRYKLKLVDDRSYLVQLARYIHQNPVVAGLVQMAEDWDFGSYRDFLGENRFGFLTREALFDLAGGKKQFASFSRLRELGQNPGIERYLIEKPLG
jgi:putative transposase